MVENIAVSVADQLDLDMARLFDEFFGEHAVVAERAFGLARGRQETLARFGIVPGDAHALAPAAGRGLDHHRIADLARHDDAFFGVFDRFQIARHGRYTGLLREYLRFDLVAHRGDGLHRRADEHDAGLLEGGRKRGVFRQEPVARMHGLGPRRFARGQDRIDLEIALGRRCRPDPHGLVGLAHMQGLGVGIRIDRDGLDAEALGRAHHAHRNLAAIGDEDFAEQFAGLRCSFFFLRGHDQPSFDPNKPIA